MKKILIGIILVPMLIWWVSYWYNTYPALESQISYIVSVLKWVIGEQWEETREKILEKIDELQERDNSEKIEYVLEEIEKDLNTVSYYSSYTGKYTISDTTYGTEVNVFIEGNERVMESNGLPNHATGDFPNSGNPNAISEQDLEYRFPFEPVYVWNSAWSREPWVALNWVKFEPETAERVECTSGESYKIEAIQDMVNLGLDNENAHVQPTWAYHYHGVSQWLVSAFDSGYDLVHVWYALDGFKIMYSKSSKFSPSYEISTEKRTWTNCTYRWKTVDIEWSTPDGTYVSDWVYTDWLWDLDACHGIDINDEYMYIITDQYQFVWRCLNGEFEESMPWGGGHTWDHSHPHPNPRR